MSMYVLTVLLIVIYLPVFSVIHFMYGSPLLGFFGGVLWFLFINEYWVIVRKGVGPLHQLINRTNK